MVWPRLRTNWFQRRQQGPVRENQPHPVLLQDLEDRAPQVCLGAGLDAVPVIPVNFAEEFIQVLGRFRNRESVILVENINPTNLKMVSNKLKSLKMLEDAYARKYISRPEYDTKEIDSNIQLAQTLGITGYPYAGFARWKGTYR